MPAVILIRLPQARRTRTAVLIRPRRSGFVQITADDGEDLPIPLETFGFKTLLQAQADGDFEALQAKGQRALRLHLGGDVQAGLAKLAAVIEALAAKRR